MPPSEPAVTSRFSSLAGWILVAACLAARARVAHAHDETSEKLGLGWTIASPSPGAIPSSGAAAHLLISEFAITPTASEFIEVMNPTSESVDLARVYLSDDWNPATPRGYYQLPATGYAIPGSPAQDFTVRFPNFTTLVSRGALVIASNADDFKNTYGQAPDFEINSTDPNVPDMVDVSGNAPRQRALLANAGEFIMLFSWDGSSDLVCDIDYVQWGATGENGVVKTGLSVDGPDAGSSTSAYAADTPLTNQVWLVAPTAGQSLARISRSEGPETAGGNGCAAMTPTGVAVAPEPAGIALTPAHPNPFTRGTQLGFTSTRAGPARVGIYDLAGTRVRNLPVPGAGLPGRHDIAWDGCDDSGRPVRPGVYFAVAEVAGSRAVARLVRLQ